MYDILTCLGHHMAKIGPFERWSKLKWCTWHNQTHSNSKGVQVCAFVLDVNYNFVGGWIFNKQIFNSFNQRYSRGVMKFKQHNFNLKAKSSLIKFITSVEVSKLYSKHLKAKIGNGSATWEHILCNVWEHILFHHLSQ